MNSDGREGKHCAITKKQEIYPGNFFRSFSFSWIFIEKFQSCIELFLNINKFNYQHGMANISNNKISKKNRINELLNFFLWNKKSVIFHSIYSAFFILHGTA